MKIDCIDEYQKNIDALLKDNELSVDGKLNELEKMYVLKPVRASWYLAKARLAYEKEQKWAVGHRELKGKFFLSHSDDITVQVMGFQSDLDLKAKDRTMADYRAFQIHQLKGEPDAMQKVILQLREGEIAWLEKAEPILSLAKLYLSCGKILNYYVLKCYEESIGGKTIPSRGWIRNSSNFGYIKECIANKNTIAIVADSSAYHNEAFVLGYCLSQVGCPVYVLTQPEDVDVDSPVALDKTVSISMENAKEYQGFTLVPTVELMLQGVSVGDNCPNIINNLCADGTVLVLASSRKFEELSRSNVLRNRIDNLFGYQENFQADYYAFGWCGSYLDYIGQLYNMDTKEAVYRKPECKFSIVIPARNSATTLQHTLKTCFNQRWQGDFEIVISDNSTENNNEVYQFCQTLQDERIKYYKTPRDLRLNRSFEYAFLQTKGEYVLSIGSDDALLPWTMEVWDQVISDYPEEEIFLWDRGFYAWPGFNDGQQHQFSVPGKYRKGNYKVEYVEPVQYLSWAMDKPNAMYLLPMLYINSGFKRSFMQTLLEETGRLWDGVCQDLYMGVIVSVIKEKIIKINYPLTMAGMSSGSVGALSTLPMTDQVKGRAVADRELKTNNVGGFSKSQVETLTPELGSDVTSLYNSILRAVNRGLIPRHYLADVFDWKTWFMNSYRVMGKEDIYFDRKIHQMRFAAMKHGEEFLKWFDENIYEEALTPIIPVKRDKSVKLYQEYDNENGMTLDASKYGVHNSYEASLLFEKVTGL